MLNLVMKDVLIQKKSAAYSIFFAFLMVFSFQSIQGNGAYLMGAMGVVFLLVAGAFAYDERGRGDILINSLPIARQDVVGARYLSLFVFSMAAVLMVTLAGTLLKLSGLNIKLDYISPADMLGMFITLVVLFSIYIPIYFKFGYVKSRMVNVILYASVLAFAGIISGISGAVQGGAGFEPLDSLVNTLQGIPSWMVGPILVLTGAALVSLSYCLSVKFYKKREF
jgi:hypothetical protein